MPDIYIVNDQGHDFTPAREHLGEGGRFVTLTAGRVNIFDTVALIEHLKAGMAKASPNDFLLLTGNQTVAVLAALMWLEWFGEANLLIWGASLKGYVPRHVTRKQLLREPVSLQPTEASNE